ncbi:hypothetical protein ACOTWJ_06920 [Aliarcobacter butzleri]
MSLKIKIKGGYADHHKIPLNDMAKLSKSIQIISKNFEVRDGKKIYTDIYIDSAKEGCFEIALDLLQNNAYVQGIGAAYLYDLSKDIKNFVLYNDKKKSIESLVNDVYNLSIELADADYYDYRLEQKKQELEEKEKILNAEFSTFNAIKEISSLVKGPGEDESLKPESITFSINQDEELEEFNFDLDAKQKIQIISNNRMELDDVIVKGIPTNVSKESNNFFKMKVPFFGLLKIYANKEAINILSNYFIEEKPVTIKINPIVKMGELVKTKEARLVEIIKDEEE